VAVLWWLSCGGCPVVAALWWLSCNGWAVVIANVVFVASWLSFSAYPPATVPCGCSVVAVLW
jgi:hypothetical protein